MMTKLVTRALYTVIVACGIGIIATYDAEAYRENLAGCREYAGVYSSHRCREKARETHWLGFLAVAAEHYIRDHHHDTN